VTVKVIDGRLARDWSPPQPLSLSDFNLSSLSDFIRGYSESRASDERKQRVENALREFDQYFAQQAVSAGECIRLVRTAQQLAADDHLLSVLLFGRPLCPSPRITVTLPAQNRVVVVMMQNGGAASDCENAAEGRRIAASFPQAFITPALDGSTLGAILAAGSFPSNSVRVSVRGCGQALPQYDRPQRQATRAVAQSQDDAAILLVGRIGSSATWGSGWIDLTNPVNFSKGEKLRIKVGGTADRVVVRLTQKGADPDSSSGVIPVIMPVPHDNRTIEVLVPDEMRQVIQASVHGLSNPWNQFPLGSGNGPATLISAERVR